jgi:hypothetical protein
MVKESKNFKKNTYYRAKQLIMTPNGVVKKGLIPTGEEWENLLVYDIGNCDIKGMFDIINENNNTHC